MTRRPLLPYLVVALLCACANPRIPPQEHGGTVSSATPEATAAGLEVLAAGGNAIDAAIAVSFALGVSEPAGSGIGGQVMMLVHRPGKEPFVILGTSLAPSKLPPKVTPEDLVGHRATTVPSAVRVLDLAYRRFGSGKLPWSQLLQPAIRVAYEGFRLGQFRQASVQRYSQALGAWPRSARVFLEADGTAPRVGSLVRRPDLAYTLRQLATEGAEDFYHGRIATEIAADMARNGGWITKEDLALLPAPRVVPAVRGTYRGYDVYTVPPPGGGWVVLQALNILEHAPPESLAAGRGERFVWLAEALRAAHGNRANAPVRDLQQYEEDVRRRTSKEAATRLVQRLGLARSKSESESGETTHFCVVDGDGMAVSVTQSLNAYFGAKVLCGSLGFLYNDYMQEFEIGSAQHPFALQAGGMPYSSMSATILTKDGNTRLLLGSPGSRRIISAVVQVISYWVDGRLEIERAVAGLRIHVTPEDDDLHFERRPYLPLVVGLLERRGFSVSVPLSSLYRKNVNPYFGGVHAVALTEDGIWHGAADPRRDGSARSIYRP
jgi:gamma-glutamyltranspeptidase/glutathione hydrolase